MCVQWSGMSPADILLVHPVLHPDLLGPVFSPFLPIYPPFVPRSPPRFPLFCRRFPLLSPGSPPPPPPVFPVSPRLSPPPPIFLVPQVFRRLPPVFPFSLWSMMYREVYRTWVHPSPVRVCL